MTTSFAARVTVGLSALALAVACSGGDNKTPAGGSTTAAGNVSGSVDLNGAGATFPQPIYNKWFSDYATRTGVKINYQSIGSGGGVRQIMDQTVDFGASDASMSDDELSKAKGGPLMHFPTVLGAVVLTYNVPGVTQTLKVSGDVISDIFLGKITKWNDPRIATPNPGANLPNSDILVVHRSDGSGTTFVWTDYLAAVSPEWRTKVGKGKEVKWPVGIGGKGNEGVAGQVKQTPGSVGYVELAYAKQNRLPYAHVKNSAGNFIDPNISSITAAAEAANIPDNTDYRVSIVNSPGPQAYPISAFTWLLIYRHQPDAAKAKKLKDFLRYAYTEGEQAAAALDYARIPEAMTSRLIARLDSIGTGTTP